MLHKEFFGYVFLGLVAWVFLAASPQARIERFCRPVGWIGNGTVSLASLALPNQQERVQGWFDKVEYGCRYVTWRLLYQDDYNKWLATISTGSAEEGTALSSDGTTTTPPAPVGDSGVEKQAVSEQPAKETSQ